MNDLLRVTMELHERINFSIKHVPCTFNPSQVSHNIMSIYCHRVELFGFIKRLVTQKLRE